MKHIPEEILNECAFEAFKATEAHYNAHVYSSHADLWAHEKRVQARVLKDVKAVLYGNRTSQQLHDAWCQRKFKAIRNYAAMEERYPTSTESFYDLSEDDQAGYNIFVNTVLSTYRRLTVEQAKASKHCGARLFHSASGREHAMTGKVYGGSLAFVEVFFDTPEKAQEFYDSLKTK